MKPESSVSVTIQIAFGAGYLRDPKDALKALELIDSIAYDYSLKTSNKIKYHRGLPQLAT